MCVLIVVVITRPPEDTTVCRGSDVIISCGHNSTDTFDTVWGFNGSIFSLIVNGQVYRAINQTLIIFSINYTTTVQCSVHITELSIVLTSGTATVTVVGMYKCILCMYVLIQIRQAKYNKQDRPGTSGGSRGSEEPLILAGF